MTPKNILKPDRLDADQLSDLRPSLQTVRLACTTMLLPTVEAATTPPRKVRSGPAEDTGNLHNPDIDGVNACGTEASNGSDTKGTIVGRPSPESRPALPPLDRPSVRSAWGAYDQGA